MKNSEIAPKEAPEKDSQETTAGFSYENLELTLPEMLKAGLHFGHKDSRWNPKMKPYIFGTKNNIHIIDLEKTLVAFQKALDFLRSVVQNGGKILFIGTKPQVRLLLAETAKATDSPYVNNRWLGGTFTNFGEIKGRLKHLNEQESFEKSGDSKKYTKYEQVQLKKEIRRMNEKMGGNKNMDKLPQAVFVVDIKENALAVKEAREVGVPTIAVTDTNTDPTLVDYPIPANDDALSSLKYILGIVAKNIVEVKKEIKSEKPENTKKNK